MHLTQDELGVLVVAVVGVLHAVQLAIVRKLERNTRRAPRRSTDPPPGAGGRRERDGEPPHG